MTFKEECLKYYEDAKKRNEIERKKRTEESRRRERIKIVKEFEFCFKRPFKKEYLIEEQNEHGYVLYTIVIDEIRILVNFQGGNNYNGAYYLLVPCHKCGKETTYKNHISSPFLFEIGRILNEDPNSNKKARICGACREEEREENKKIRETNYIKRSKERNSDLYSKLADALAEVFRRGGYRDMISDEEIEY